MPKMKTHRGTAKRVKVTGTGKYVCKTFRNKPYFNSKTKKRKNKLKKDFVVLDIHKKDMVALLPYGVGR